MVDRPNDPLCMPVNPHVLFRKLASALSVAVGDNGDGDVPFSLVVRRDFPDTGSPDFRERYLLMEVLRKYPDWDASGDTDTRQVAIDSFLKQEDRNCVSNSRLRTVCPNPEIGAILHRSGQLARGILGRFDRDQWWKHVRMGPGATTRVQRRNAFPDVKLSGSPTVTSKAYGLMSEVISMCPQWAYRVTNPEGRLKEEERIVPCALTGEDWTYRSCSLPLTTRETSRGDTVSKNAETDRFITIENDLNVIGQLGIGQMMRERLLHVGINLSDQSINQKAARLASLTGEDATVDLRNASNSNVYELVRRHLEDDGAPGSRYDATWWRIMETLRCEYTVIDGNVHENALYSGMGNGFTFELETLLYFSLAKATCEHLGAPTDRIVVYGDDIVIPCEAVPLFKDVLEWCGIELNERKTHVSSTYPIFRESCGKHYLGGVDVTPFYVDGPLSRLSEIVLLANNITRWARMPVIGSVGHYVRDSRLLPVWQWVVSHIRDDVRRECRIPYCESDDGLIVDFDVACPSAQYEVVHRTFPKFDAHGDELSERRELPVPVARHLTGFRVKTFAFETREVVAPGDASYTSWLYDLSVNRIKIHTPQPQVTWWVKPPKAGMRGFGYVTVNTTVREPHPTKRPESLKKSVRFRTRVVVNWANPGPWARLVADEKQIDFGGGSVVLCDTPSHRTPIHAYQIEPYGSTDEDLAVQLICAVEGRRELHGERRKRKGRRKGSKR